MKHEKIMKRALAAAKLIEAGYTITDHECGEYGGREKCYVVVGPDDFYEFVQKTGGVWE